MRKLLLNDLAVESFATDDGGAVPLSPVEPAGLTDGWECGKTGRTCGPPECNTYRQGNCV